MDIYFKIILLFLLWVCKCRSTPTPNGNPPSSRIRLNSGWSQNRNFSAGGSGTRVVYPDNLGNANQNGNKAELLQTRLGPVLPELPSSCSMNERFCNATNYPKEHVEKLLLKSGLLRQGVFSMDASESKEAEEDNLGTRQGGVDNGTPLCLSVVDAKPANTGVDKDGKRRFIINHENVTQPIRREKCESVDSPCKFDTFPNNYVVKCRQKYTERKLAALNDQNEIEWMFFPTPSCCVCSYYSKRTSRSIFTTANQSTNLNKISTLSSQTRSNLLIN